jgi:hypothetical protein
MTPALKIAVGFGVASSVARTLGIVRWLSVMPVLASLYVNGSAQTRAMVSVVYEAINAYGGMIGEALGVGLFAGLWLLLLAISMLRCGRFPRWLGLFGLISGVVVTIQAVELFGIDLGALISVGVTVLHLWLITAGGYLIARSRKSLPAAENSFRPIPDADQA